MAWLRARRQCCVVRRRADGARAPGHLGERARDEARARVRLEAETGSHTADDRVDILGRARELDADRVVDRVCTRQTANIPSELTASPAESGRSNNTDAQPGPVEDLGHAVGVLGRV